MKYQTDYDGHILKDGCLLCVLVTIAEERINKELTKLEFLKLVEMLNVTSTNYNYKIPTLSNEFDQTKQGSFVWDHEKVANETLRLLKYTREKLVYCGRIYMPWEEMRGKVSFGDRWPCDEIVLQIQTINGGHFRRPNHDPYRPGTKMIDLKSLRYYRWVRS